MLPSRTRRGNSRVNRAGTLLRGLVTQPNKALLVLAILAGVVCIALFGLKAIGPSTKPTSQRPLTALDASRMPAFEAQFDTARDSTRLLVLLSPT